MKANEIQIGNLLYYKGQFNAFPFKVESITKKKVGYHAEPNEHRMHYLRLSECKPIPLTLEILEKNGFHKDDEDTCGVTYHLLVPTGYERNSFTIQLTLYKEPICGVKTLVKCWGWIPPYNGGINDIHLCNVEYVHELQHALRLCGINHEIIL